jgi:CelD/BcsL family acetyltransferase involved in cellulose biosynthesis
MDYEISTTDFEWLAASWEELSGPLHWGSVFVLPWWLRAWWQEFGGERAPLLLTVRGAGDVIGIAPLAVVDNTASFMGSSDVCDYLDFIIAPGKGPPFFDALLNHLERKGIREIRLESLRGDSSALTVLAPIAERRGYAVSSTRDGVSVELDLPASWEEYLHMLSGKQRREAGRKLRRLEEEGGVRFVTAEDQGSVQQTMDVFLAQFRESREDKGAFMTPRMKTFFRSVADAMAQVDMLRLSVLELDRAPVASVMCFDYNDTVYLYHSGYSHVCGRLSPGFLSKLLSIRDSIERGRSRYDFLKGAEEYKYRLGGKEVPLYTCRIDLH